MSETIVDLNDLNNLISQLQKSNLITPSMFSTSKPSPNPSPVEEDKGTYTVDEFIQKYKNDPELRKLPLPDYVYEKYGIPKPDVLGLNTYLFKSIKACMNGGQQSETREADNKGVRKMPFLSTVEGYDLSGNVTTYLSSFTS